MAPTQISLLNDGLAVSVVSASTLFVTLNSCGSFGATGAETLSYLYFWMSPDENPQGVRVSVCNLWKPGWNKMGQKGGYLCPTTEWGQVSPSAPGLRFTPSVCLVSGFELTLDRAQVSCLWSSWAQPHTVTYIDTHSCSHTQPQIFTRSFTFTVTLTHSNIHPHSHTQSHTLTHTVI
jgi:hypothetical protein